MLLHASYPPKEFTHQEWCEVRDELFRLGSVHSLHDNKVRRMLRRASMAMNNAQENYGRVRSFVGHQCGRLFVERVVFFLIGAGRTDHSDTLNMRINQLRTPGSRFHNQISDTPLIRDLHLLRDYGNRVDHEELDNLKSDELPDVVHLTYRTAKLLLVLGKIKCRNGLNCKYGRQKKCFWGHY